MADTDLHTIINNPHLPQNPNKFYTHFFFKAVFVSIFLLILPLFPSEAPDFINQTINTRSWELLQLLVVGIAVSYGLFSKRNDETQKEQQQQGSLSYVARLLQVSSVFDDDSENPSASESEPNNSKVQTWNSQYYRGEPIVVVAKENSQQAAESATVEKPLLLPVRSLKNGVSESSPMIDSKVGRSNSRRFSRNLSKLSGGVSPEEESEENIVLRSPIPWRSRSGRMEIKEDFTQTPEINPIDSPSSRYRSSKPSSDPPSLSLPSEIQSKSLQDVGRKKTIHKSSFSPIPPPPPPPPPPSHLSYTQKTNDTYSRKEFRNARSFPNKFSEDLDLQNRGRKGAELIEKSKSFRTRQETEFDEYLIHDKEIESFIERRGSQKKNFTMDDTQISMDYPKEEKNEFMEGDKDEDLEESEEEGEGDDELQELASKKNGEMVGSDNGPDVDKKADEFIAKFREQIRLQRIASIRRSTAQTPRDGGR